MRAITIPDATAPHRYAADPYFVEATRRSVLCLPIVRDAKSVAVLYLENDLMPGAFDSPQLAVLDVLASQAAISLDNARLYERIARTVAVDTHRNTLAECKTFLGWCVRQTWLRANPLESVEGRGKRSGARSSFASTRRAAGSRARSSGRTRARRARWQRC